MNTTSTSSDAAPTPKGTGRRRSVATGLVGGLLAGTAAGLVLGVPGLSSAATDVTQPAVGLVAQVDSETDTGAETDTDAPRPDRSERLRELLQELVDDGTLTAAQADTVATHLVENAPERGHRGPRGGGVISEVITETLGLDAAELREQLQSGATLADIAASQNVEVQTLIDALVAEAQVRLDAAVADGKLTADEAADKAATIEERVTAGVNGERPEGAGRPGPGGPRGGSGD